MFYQFEYSFTTQDTILDAHEHYYYSEMVKSWGSPPDTNYILKEVKNLQIWCGIYNKDSNDEGRLIPGRKYWSNLPENIHVEDFFSWAISTDYKEMYNITIPFKTQTGEINTMPVTVVDNGELLFYLELIIYHLVTGTMLYLQLYWLLFLYWGSIFLFVIT